MKLWYAVVLSMTLAVAAPSPIVQDLETRLSQAKAEMASGNWAQAESMLQAIIEDDENYAPAFFELSVVLLERDNLKGTQENITKAIEKDPRTDEFRSKTGQTADLPGRSARGRRCGVFGMGCRPPARASARNAPRQPGSRIERNMKPDQQAPRTCPTHGE